MSNLAQLKQQLKALKLSGTLESLELRLMEAAQNQLSFNDMLSMVLADELETRQQRSLQETFERCTFSQSDKTLESFDFSF